MFRKIMLVPIDINVNLSNISLGILNILKKRKIQFNFFKLIKEKSNKNEKDQMIEFFRKIYNIHIPEPIDLNKANNLIIHNKKNKLIEKIIFSFYGNKMNEKITFIEGISLNKKNIYLESLNFEIAKSLATDIIFVCTLKNKTKEELKEQIELNYAKLKQLKTKKNIIGVIINEFNLKIFKNYYNKISLFKKFITSKKNKLNSKKINSKTFSKEIKYPFLGYIPLNLNLITIKCIDIIKHLNAKIINKGKFKNKKIKSIILPNKNLINLIKSLKKDSLLIVSYNFNETIIAASLATMNGIKIGAVLITNDYQIKEETYKFCLKAFKKGLSIFLVEQNISEVLLSLKEFKFKININGFEKIKKIQNFFYKNLNKNWITSIIPKYEKNNFYYKSFSPYEFKYSIIELARKKNRRIVLPEGHEPRTIRAALICKKMGIADCILLGDPQEIYKVSDIEGINFKREIEIINPITIRKNYINRMIELRKNKGMNENIASEKLKDNIVLGTMMLEQNDVDGLVSGAINTTANTIRPALQLIKTSPGNSIISSVFFMLFPEKILIYGDCAINQNPTAQQLSEIAIQSANFARKFGIKPYIAMISYSTGNSSFGVDVDKVKKATEITKKNEPNLNVDGPLQYDAAIIKEVAKIKAPYSKVAGKATICIFPDLNTGNTTYKAVQRSADLISIGPILQGIKKPVNDLSRGALIEDIIYTIAITAIQSNEEKNFK